MVQISKIESQPAYHEPRAETETIDEDNSKISNLQLIKSIFYQGYSFLIFRAMQQLYFKGLNLLIDRVSPDNTDFNSKRNYGLAGIALFHMCRVYFSNYITPRLLLSKELPKDTYASVYEIVKELSAKAEIPMPKLWKSPDMTANACAYGIRQSSPSIVISHGALQIWNDAELRAILSHEITHIKNRDVLVQELFQAAPILINAGVYYRYGGEAKTFKESKEAIADPVSSISWFLSKYVNRSQEFRADKMGAEISDDPSSLASALKKMHESHWFLKLCDNICSNKVINFFLDHPPTKKRIQRLEAITTTNS